MNRFVFLLLILTGCSAAPDFFRTIDDIATDDAITIKCDRDCFKRNTTVKIDLDVQTLE